MEAQKIKLEVDYPDTLISINNLSVTYKKQGRWDKAEELDLRAMETSKTQLKASHPDTLTSIANLALTYIN